MKKTIILLIITTFLLMGFSSCGNETEVANKSGSGTVEVWTCSSTEKVFQEKSYDGEEKKSTLSVSMARNEYESAQIILSAKENVAKVDVTLSNLVSDAGETFPKERISVYWEKYMEIKTHVASYYDFGYLPDAIVPFENLKTAGENSILKDQNQGLYVKFSTIDSEFNGKYTGNIKIICDGKEYSVPVSLTVWDFEVGDAVHTKSSFLSYNDALTQGEDDSSMEMYRKYYEFFLDNRLSLMNLPASLNQDEYIEEIVKYSDNPKMSAYNIAYVGYNGNVDMDRLECIIKGIIARSYKDKKDYLRKGYVYNLYTDEYSTNRVKMEKAKTWIKEFNALKENLEKFFDDKYGAEYLDSVEGLRFSVRNILDLSVTAFIADLSDQTNCIVTGVNDFKSQKDRDRLNGYFSDEGDEIWWYGCYNPQYPYPTYHYDDHLNAPRILSWMQYDYEVNGNLYYCVNMYYGDAGENLAFPIDEWTLANRNLGGGKVNGDGWLVYPGAKYGVDGPISSLRLEAIRDGLEEYEYLYYIDELLKPIATNYGIEGLRATDIIRSILDNLYYEVWITTDSEKLTSAREEVASIITELKNFDFFIANTEKAYDYDILSVYVPEDAVLSEFDESNSVLDSQDCVSGKKYRIKINKENGKDTFLKFDLTVGDRTLHVNRFIEKAVYDLVTLDNSEDGNYFGFDTSKDNEKVVSNGEIRFDLVSDAESLTYKPYISLQKSLVALISKKADKIILEVKNDNDFEITFDLYSRQETYETLISKKTISAGKTEIVEIAVDDIENTLSFRLYTDNVVNDGVAERIKIAITAVGETRS